MERQVLIIDSNSYLYRAAYAFGTDGNGIITGVTKYITEIVDNEDFADVVMCWDKGKSRWRREIFPEYKRGRKEKAKPIDMDAVHKQARIVRSYFEKRRIRQIYVNGVEADDLISWISDYYRDCLGYDKVVITTSDKDLWQLLNGSTTIYDHLKGKSINEEIALEEFGLECNKIPDLKSIAGDTSDNIKGVVGIGDKTAVELINKYGSLGNILDLNNVKEISSKKRTRKMIEQSCSAELSYRLVKIPTLKEAKWYLNDEESAEFIYRISKKIGQDKLGAQLMADRLPDSSLLYEEAYPLAEEDLTGMKTFFEEGGEEKHFSLASVDNSILQCRICGLRDDCDDFGPTLAEGYEDAEIMVIGRNPGVDELRGGRPFIGKAGRRLDEFLEYIGLIRRDCWITNVNKCYSENNRPTTIGEMKACSKYLRAEIDLVKPKFIMVFGNEAMAMTTPYGYKGITKHCGEILERPTGVLGNIHTWVAICVHPSMALRSKAGELHMEYAAKQIKEFLDARR